MAKCFRVVSVMYFILLFAACYVSYSDKNTKNIIFKPFTEESLEEKDTNDKLNYQQFLRYIWIPDVRDINPHSSISFRLNEVNNGVVLGTFALGIASPPVFSYLHNEFNYFAEYLVPDNNIRLVLKDNIANGYFMISNTRGHISMKFTEDGLINVTIEYSDIDRWHKNLQDANYLFRPLNISDIDSFEENKKISFLVNLNSWGKVYLRAGHYEPRRVMHLPDIFLTDLDGNILYNFSAGYQVGTVPHAVVAKDFNNDNLLDILIVTSDDVYGKGYIYRFYWYFYQLPNGWFYSVSFEMSN